MAVPSSFDVLVSLKCVVKLYLNSSTQLPKEHSCTLSLGTTNGESSLRLEGAGVRSKIVKFKAHNIEKVETKRLNEGHISIIFSGHYWETIVVSKVENLNLLQHFCASLKEMVEVKNVGKTDFSKLRAKTPPTSTNHVSARSTPLSLKSINCKKRPVVNPLSHPNNRRGAAMVAAATQPVSSKSPGVFYKSSGLPVTEPFLPTKSPSYSPIFPRRNPSPHVGARRNLSLVMGRHENEYGTAEDSSDFVPPTQQFRKSQFHSRLPLSDVSEVKVNQPVANFALSPDYPQSLDGFANLGNTCYMNAVLQSLIGLDPFAEDILNYELVRKVSTKSLYLTMYLLVKSKRAKESYESQRILLKKIKSAISHRTSKFGSYRQQDAHELLGQCLDQLKDDSKAITVDSTSSGVLEDKQEVNVEPFCPVKRNFECEILHIITCRSCKKATKKSEIIYDFALQLPKSVLIRPNEQANLQQLFDIYFSAEDVEFTCTSCGGKTATIQHYLSKLPRVMILHLKRYGYNTELSKNSKRVDSIRIPRSINIGNLCRTDVTSPCKFRGPWPRNPSVVSGNKENSDPPHSLATSPFHTTTPTIQRTDKVMEVISVPESPPRNTCIQETKASGAVVSHDPTYIDVDDGVVIMDDKSPNPNLRNQEEENCYLNRGTPSILGKRSCTDWFDDAQDSTSASYPKPKASQVVAHDDRTPESREDLVIHGKPPVLTNWPGSEDGIPVSREDLVREHVLTNWECSKNGTPELREDFVCGGPAVLTKGVTCSSSRSESQSSDDGYKSLDESKKKREVMDEFDMLVASPSLFDFDIEEFTQVSEKSHSNSNNQPFPQLSSATSHSRSDMNSVPGSLHSISHSSATPTCSHSSTIPTESRSHSCATPHSYSTPPASPAPMPIISSAAFNSSTVQTLSLSSSSSHGHHKDSALTEEDQLKKAMEESLRGSVNEFQLLHQLGMSEADQLKLAMELSIQEASICESTSDSPCPLSPVAPEITSLASPTNVTSSNLEAYRLISVVSHLGRGSGGGHYISDVYSNNERCWKTYNDSVVSEAKEEEIRQKRQTTGYIFFYMHRSTLNSVQSN